MTRDTKSEIRGLGKILGVIGVASGLVYLVSAAVLPPAEKKITFAFDKSPSPQVVGYKVYYGSVTNQLVKVVDIKTNRVFTITNAPYPLLAYVTAYDANGLESEPSNLAGVLGEDVVTTVFGQTNSNPSLSNKWTDSFAVDKATNVSGQLFYRLRIDKQTTIRKFP